MTTATSTLTPEETLNPNQLSDPLSESSIQARKEDALYEPAEEEECEDDFDEEDDDEDFDDEDDDEDECEDEDEE